MQKDLQRSFDVHSYRCSETKHVAVSGDGMLGLTASMMRGDIIDRRVVEADPASKTTYFFS